LAQKTGEVKGCSDVVSLGAFVHPGNPVVPVATSLPVAQLPAGSYRLEVRGVIPNTQLMATRAIDFELN